MARVLYISYDGLLEPIGQSQILQYVERLAGDHSIWLLTFEKPADMARSDLRTATEGRLRELGIRWTRLRYHKQPSGPATAFDMAIGTVVAFWIALRGRIQVTHARSYAPAIISLVLRKVLRAPFIFDMRGFWADQRLESGQWHAGPVYRTAKWFERQLLRSADVVISETEAAIDVMKALPYLAGRSQRFEVVATATNLDRFQGVASAEGKTFEAGFVGSLGVWYDLDKMLGFFALVRRLRPAARFLIVNQDAHERIRAALPKSGLDESCVEVRSARYDEVGAQIARMRAGIYFLNVVPSMVAVCPTKLGEFLGSGVPVLTNPGVGDTERILSSEGVGVVFGEGPESERLEAVKALLQLAEAPGIAQRCSAVARKYFDLEQAVKTHDRLYRELAAAHG
jgi:glycosyltransferase involved in cell wall biosynthesis